MNSEMIESPEKPQDYPYLAINKKHGNFVVMFSAPDTGMVVWANVNSYWPLGSYSEDWVEDSFNLCDQRITLSNK